MCKYREVFCNTISTSYFITDPQINLSIPKYSISHSAYTPGNMIGKTGHIGPQHHLTCWAIKKCGHSFSCSGHSLDCLKSRWIAASKIGSCCHHPLGHCFNHILCWHILEKYFKSVWLESRIETCLTCEAAKGRGHTKFLGIWLSILQMIQFWLVKSDNWWSH